MSTKTEILLESGTNELEIIEFRIDEVDPANRIKPCYYGVNVGKVREIINVPKLTSIPDSHPAVAGIAPLRDEVITIVDTGILLSKNTGDAKPSKVIVMEFNNVRVGIMVHSVSRIHRISWARVEPPVSMLDDGLVTSLVKMDDRIIMLLDFEKIIADICPETAMKIPAGEQGPESTEQRRQDKTLLIADDSGFIRKNIKTSLERAGYNVVEACDGQEALDKLLEFRRQAEEAGDGGLARYVDLVITDIEMPRMDGLHLTRRIKSETGLQALPVLIFSSMASPDNVRKWQEIGAERIITKPDLPNLINLVDEYVLDGRMN